MLGYLWPIALVVVSNTFYQICTKDVPEKASPFASLTVTYLVGAVICAVLHFITHPGTNPIRELSQLNWTSWALGLVIVGLEAGWIFAYKAGWQVSTGNIVQSAVLAALLIGVGYFVYHETLSWNKLVGVAVCLVGLVFINLK